MKAVIRLVISGVLVLCCACTGSGILRMQCERENLWGSTEYFTCPESSDNPDDRYCCGFGDHKYCCSSPPHEELIEDIMEHLPTLLGVIFTVVIVIFVLCIVCCCCCPFCLLYKHRNRGTVHNPNPEAVVMQPLQAQPQAYPPPNHQQPPYPVQAAPYPTQPGYLPQNYAGYPNEQPPMYTEKQPPPYNPNI